MEECICSTYSIFGPSAEAAKKVAIIANCNGSIYGVVQWTPGT